MAKTLTVYTLYGDEEALQLVLKRLIENSYSFHYTGEFLYDSTPWDDFLDFHCRDIRHRLNTHVEHWSDTCLNFDCSESETEFTFYEDSAPICRASVKPCHLIKATALFRKLCSQAESLGSHILFDRNK